MRFWWPAVMLAGCYSPPGGLCKPGMACRTLVIQNGGTGDLTGVPLLVELDASALDYGKVADPTTDLRFYDAVTDQDLPFEIDRWVPGGTSDVWVRVPSLTGHGPFDNITMFAGRAANGMADPAGVWSDFALVAHLGDMQLNSASTAYAPAPTGVTTADGKIGGAAAMTGSGDERIEFQGATDLISDWPTFTLEVWVWPDYATMDDLASQPAIFQKHNTIDGGRLFTNGFAMFQADIIFNNDATEYLNTNVDLRAWNYYVYTYDGNVLQLYANGALQSSSQKPMHPTLGTSTEPFFLGSSGNPLHGLIDELRVSRQPRSADWILEQYLSAQRLLITLAP